MSLPKWLVKGETILLPKNTKITNNYCLIACLNINDKISTNMLNQFLSDHCITNNTITTEQSREKKVGDKMILYDVQHQQQNLLTM